MSLNCPSEKSIVMVITSRLYARIVHEVLVKYKKSVVGKLIPWGKADMSQNEFWGYNKSNTGSRFPDGLCATMSQDPKVKSYINAVKKEDPNYKLTLRSVREKLEFYDGEAHIGLRETFPDSLWKICQWLLENEKAIKFNKKTLIDLNIMCLYAFEKNYEAWVQSLPPLADHTPAVNLNEPLTLTYRLHFFSHIRYAIWNQGVFTFDFTNFDSLKDLNDEHNFIAVEARGVFDNPEIVYTGKCKGVEEGRLFLDMDFKGGGNLTRNKLKIAALINKEFSFKKKPEMFCSAHITKSSHRKRNIDYIACIEGVFIREDLVKEKERLDMVKSYLMLRRNRFEVAEKLEIKDFQDFFDDNRNTLPENAQIQYLKGYWICLSKVNECILLSKLHVNDYFCTELWTRIDDSTSGEPGTNNYQLCYFEFYGNHKRGVLLKGYAASHPLYPESLNAQDTEKPKEIGNLLSTFIIEIPKEKHDVLSGTFNSAIKLKDGEESLWAGPVKLLAIDEKTYEKCTATTIAMKDSMQHLRQILNGRYEHEIQLVLNIE